MDRGRDPEYSQDFPTEEDRARAIRTRKGIMEREVVGAIRFNFTSLQHSGFLDEFWTLVMRVGVTRDFFTIPVHHRAYAAITSEFFSTVHYYSCSAQGDHPEPYIGFYLGGARYTLTMQTLRSLLHLPTEFQLESYAFPVGPDGVPVTTLAGFWSQISHPSFIPMMPAASTA